MNVLKSKGVKRNLGGAIVIMPMIVQYAAKLFNAQAGTDFQIDADLLNICYLAGGSIWSIGSLHAYLPKILGWTLKIEKALEVFNAWAQKKIKSGGK